MWHHRGLPKKTLGAMCEHYGVELPEDRAHTADADSYATGLLLTTMVLEDFLPDDVEWAYAEQLAIQARLKEERDQYGRFVFPDRDTGEYRLGLGKHCGTPVDEADEGYIKWLLGRPDIPAGAKSILMKATGQVEQIGLSKVHMRTIWIDADATPRPVKDILVKAAHKRKVHFISSPTNHSMV